MRMRLKNQGVLTGEWEKEVEVGDENMPWDQPIVKAFVEDGDLHEMTIVSANIGFIKTLTKYPNETGDQQ